MSEYSPRSVSPPPEFVDESPPWTAEEDMKLVQAYVSIHDKAEHFHPVFLNVTLDHSSPAFKNMLAHSFNESADPEDIRTATVINDRWSRVKRDVILFDQIFKNLDSAYPLDSEDVVLQISKDVFRTIEEDMEFALEDAWKILKELPFF